MTAGRQSFYQQGKLVSQGHPQKVTHYSVLLFFFNSSSRPHGPEQNNESRNKGHPPGAWCTLFAWYLSRKSVLILIECFRNRYSGTRRIY